MRRNQAVCDEGVHVHPVDSGYQTRCADCGEHAPVRLYEQDAWLDVNSHVRLNNKGGSSNPRMGMCPALAADRRRQVARAQRSITDEFPSIRWDADDWMRVFDRYPHVFNGFLDGIAVVSTRWRDGTIGVSNLTPQLIEANRRADQLHGIAA